MYFFLLAPFLFKLAGNRRSKCHVERVADKSRGWLARTWETGGDLLGSDIAGLLRMWLFACRCGLFNFFYSESRARRLCYWFVPCNRLAGQWFG